MTGLADNRIMNDLGSSFSAVKRNGKKVRKFALKKEGENKIIDEVMWYLNCRGNMDGPVYNSFLPEITDYSLKRGNVFYEMKYYPYPSLRTLIFEYGIGKNTVLEIIEAVVKSLTDNVYSIDQKIETPEDYVEICHLKNLANRIENAVRMKPMMKRFMSKNRIEINGRGYLNIKVLMRSIFKDEKIKKRLTPPKLWVIHGDVHYNNILCSIPLKKNVLIDCRGRSPYGTVQCDAATDIGKLYHEFRSYYSFIERNDYNLFVHETPRKIAVNFDFKRKDIKKVYDNLIGDIEKILEKNFDENEFGDWKYRAEFIEGKLYVSMLPFHLEDVSEAIVCYCTGITRLNEWLRKYHPSMYKGLARVYLA